MSRNIPKNYRWILINLLFDPLFTHGQMDHFTDIIFIFSGRNLVNQIFWVVCPIYQQHLTWRINLLVDCPHEYYPQNHNHQIEDRHIYQWQNIGCELPSSNQTQLKISNHIYAKYGKNLRIQYLKYSQISYFESTINTIK